MARVLKGSRSFTCRPRVHPLMEWTIPAFAFPAEAGSGTHLPTTDGWKTELALGWLHIEINVRHRELNPDTVTRFSINRVWRNFADRSQRANHYARPHQLCNARAFNHSMKRSRPTVELFCRNVNVSPAVERMTGVISTVGLLTAQVFVMSDHAHRYGAAERSVSKVKVNVDLYSASWSHSHL